MNQPEDVSLRNQFRGYIRTLLVLAGIFFGVAVVAALVLLAAGAARQRVPSEGVMALLLAVLIGLSLGVSMLVSALFTLPPLRQAERSFAEFREGRYLLRWDYTPESWNAYVESESQQLRNADWWLIAGIAVVVCLTCAAGGWSVGHTLNEKIRGSVLLPGIMLVGSGVALAIVNYVIQRRCRRLRVAVPRTYISSNAVYCGGYFNFWGSNARALYSIRLLPGPPQTLEFVIGLSRRAQTASKAAYVGALIGGRVIPVSSMKITQRVPIPPGAEAQAAELVRTLQNSIL